MLTVECLSTATINVMLEVPEETRQDHIHGIEPNDQNTLKLFLSIKVEGSRSARIFYAISATTVINALNSK
jgi:hypothetical protein